MAKPFAREEVERLPPLPDDLSSVKADKYAVKCDIVEDVEAEDGYVKTAMWFKLPPVTEDMIPRIKNLQLFAESRDQGTVDDEDAGTWTWFEAVILDNENSTKPSIRDNVELVWKTHFNPMKTKVHAWNEGMVIDQEHNLVRSLEAGNVIAIRLCARFQGWWIEAQKGYLAIEIAAEPTKLKAPDFGDFHYMKTTFWEINQNLNTDYTIDTPAMRADGFDPDRELPLRVLSLDGGGVRGLSSLHLLRAVMARIGTEEKPAKPCEVFDMIAGTSTGGLCAIMLGRLRLSVDECIDAYQEFMVKVFGKTWFDTLIKTPLRRKWYDAGKLEKAMKEVIEKYTTKDNKKGNPNELLLDEYNPCKVLVLSIQENAVNTKKPVFLRSYTNTQDKSLLPKIKIWEAARATSAAPTYFAPMEVDGHQLVDGGVGANNPVGWLWNEVLSVYGAGQNIRCILSIGTGIPKNTNIDGFVAAVKGLTAAATGSELTHLLFRTLLDAYAPQPRTPKYWRLNVGKEVPGWSKPGEPDNEELVALDDYKNIDSFIDKTNEYIEKQEARIQECAERMR